MTARDVFGINGTSRWTPYRVTLHIDTLVGGIPKDPDTIRAWLKARLDLGDVELNAVAEQTISDMGYRPEPDALLDTIMATYAKGNGFKERNGQLVWEGRCLKAAIREAAAVLYPGTTEWPGLPKRSTQEGKEIKVTQKGLASYLVERLEVRDLYIPLGRTKPDIAGDQRIKHITGKQGKVSTISMVDLVEDVTVSGTIDVLDDCIPHKLWGELWEYVEEGGVGADRARGDGRCQVTAWERIEARELVAV